MSKEKQIEEMARDICKCYVNGTCMSNLESSECDCMCWVGTALAPRLYDKGYRKQSEGEWVTKHRHRGGFRTVTVVDSFGEKHTGTLDDRWECDDLYCSVCGKIAHDAFLNYCANCGAKMKGADNEQSDKNNL